MRVDNSYRKVRVMQIINEAVGGIRKHVHAILVGLDANQFEQIYVHSPACDAKYYDDISSLRPHLLAEITINIRKKPHHSDITNIWRICRAVKQYDVAMLHGHGAKAGVYARIASYFTNIKSVYTPHGGATHQMFSRFEYQLYSVVERVLLPFTDCVLFESKYTREKFSDMVRSRSGRFLLNYNGIPEMQRSVIEEKSRLLSYAGSQFVGFRIGVFGALRREKGQEFAIRAVWELVREGYKVTLHIFGEGGDRARLISLVQDLSLEAHVLFYGDIADPELHMACMDLVVIPSLFESFGYVAVEAMALRKPVIATRVGGLCEIVLNGQTGVLVPPASVADLKSAIRNVMSGAALPADFADKAEQRYRSCFSESRMLANVSRVYEKLSKHHDQSTDQI